jgi:hypothetical protein
MKSRRDHQRLFTLLIRWQAQLQQKSSTCQNCQGGYALVSVILISVVLLGLLTAYALSTKVETSSSTASADSMSGYYTAEGALNMRAEELMREFSNAALPAGLPPSSLAACLDVDISNNGSGPFACRNYEFGNAIFGGQQRTATTYAVSTNPVVGGVTQSILTTIPPGEPYAGMTVQEYGYQLYSVAQKRAANLPTEAILQMNIRARYLPLFQFAVFYQNDLEMNSSSRMTLNGRVHSNTSFFYVGGWNHESEADKFTQINGQVTVACPNPDNPRCPTSGTFNGGGMFNTMKEDPAYNNTDGKAQIASLSGAWISIKSQGGNPTGSPWLIIPTLINAATGGQVRVGSQFNIQPLELPPTDALDRSGVFFQKADLRIEYRPGLAVPFEVRRVNSSSLALPRDNAEVFDLTSSRGAGVLHSLRQPVLASTALSAVTGQYAVCPNAPVAAPTISLTLAQKDAAVLALQVAIASTAIPIKFSQLNNKTGILLPNFNTVLANNPQFNGAANASLRTAVADLKPFEIAALRGRCFVPPPIQEVQDFRNDREARLIDMIQLNIGSLAVWNRDGIFVEFSGGAPVISTTGFSADQLLYTRASADSSAPAGTLQNLGYAAQDATDGGMVIHATLNQTSYPYTAKESPYGFAVTGGQQLFGLARTPNNVEPTGLSIISDQAIYLQGNYNSTRNLADTTETSGVKQPAAILADTLNVLSNICMNLDNYQIEKSDRGPTGAFYGGNDRLNCTAGQIKLPLSSIATAFTAINAAFVAATDETSSGQHNGGLNNFPRAHEDWDLKSTLFIRGSFVSLNYPINVSGKYRGNPSLGITTGHIFTPPIREWDYDVEFNLTSNLPPLTPTVRWIRQDVFLRRFDQ